VAQGFHCSGFNQSISQDASETVSTLQPDEFNTLAEGGSLSIGTTADPIARNLYKNYQTRIRERGEHCALFALVLSK
jgi:hypothetical protein